MRLDASPNLADTHCHLDFDAFNSDRLEVLDRSRQAGLSRILNPGVDLPSSRSAIQLAEAYPEVFAAVGIHPNEALTWVEDSASNQSTLKRLEALAAHSRVVAIGEVGLDYYRDRAPHDLQQRILRAQLGLAEKMNLPVIVHNRQATADILDILSEWQAALVSTASPLADRPGVLHSYSGDLEAARRAIDLHFYIGITGPVTFRNGQDIQSVVTNLPLSSLLVETDAPFLTPHPHRGQRNEPGYVRFVAEKIASLKGLPLQTVTEVTSTNAQRLFLW